MWFMDPVTARSPSVLKAIAIVLCSRALGKRPEIRIHWKETLLDMFARFLVGLVIGGLLSFLLVPVIFWPGRRRRPSLYEAFGEPAGIGRAFLVAFLGTAVVMCLRTKAHLYYTDSERTEPPL